MSLRVWLPLNGTLDNQGLDNVVVVAGTNTTFETNGKIGKCLASTGSTSNNVQITISNLETILANGNAYSVCLWAKLTNATTSGYILKIGDAPGGLWWTNVVSSSNTHRYVWNEGDSGKVLTKGDVTIDYDYWHHICVVIDKTESGYIKETYYIDGELTTGTGVTNPIRFSSSGLTTLTGTNIIIYPSIAKINDFRIYNHALSPQEVKQIAQGLVLHYPLNRNGWGNENLLSRYVVPGQAAPTSTAAGGRTTWLGDYKITIPATQDADTYFRLFTTKQLTANATYTISCKVDGLLSGSYYRFPLYAQNNIAMGMLSLDHNGLCSLTFTMTYGTQTAVTGANGETVYICFMDDAARKIVSGQGAITISNFKLEEGDKVTSWCPNSADEIANSLGMNSNIEYDISGFKNNGEKTAGLTYTSDTPKYEVATHIGATSQKIHVNNFITSGFGDSYSFSWWGKRSSNSPMFWGFSNGIRLNGMYLGNLWNTGDGSNNPIYKIGTTTQVTVPSLNVWHHYVMTGNGTKCYVYLDGELWGEAKTYKAISGTSLYINGWDGSTSYSHDNMDISDFRIYCTALSAADVKELYEYNRLG